ncbi:flavin reductase family protein [Aspergillus homomorphus CBS 101889]|uniref:Flavin reductase like domain-containing protein n=1 Tax=Aspergillus homomorphus (strain CBS 101889) TaxID=1450537 RepID=A0A395IDD9_ASPHC|nr:hypothetical protein BO97DRAFT_466844 [Aspergillus homomorphus CBS 101889]RAL17173.1 hypothetical protein BO97DRAFT_466844 [Aspergillus homomorphus CBS 101889]
MPPYSRHMLVAGRSAASSSLLRVLSPAISPCLTSAPPTITALTTGTTTILNSSIHHNNPTTTTRKRTLTTSPPNQQSQPHARHPSNPTTSTPTAPEDLSTQIRLLMRQVPYPVAIITSTDPHAHAHTSQTSTTSEISSSFRGMTVSSFNTVTLHPNPIISFNVRRPSETLSALQSSGRFLVHLLAPNPRTAALARDFSRGNRQRHGRRPHNPSADRDATDEAAAEEDFPFVFECRVLPQSVQVQDHTIVVGTVVRAIAAQGHALPLQQQEAKGLCLTYADTRFWEMGREI